MNVKKIHIGDKIAVIDELTKGTVVSVNNNIFQIKDSDGFLYFYNSDEIIKIEDNLFDNIKVSVKDNTQVNKNSKFVKAKKELIIEVDLHIHQITKSNKYLSNTDMLQKQIAMAKTKLNYAIKNKVQKIIFIHGKGQGVLKAALLKLLETYNVEINDASYKKYGQGAMEVYIYKSN